MSSFDKEPAKIDPQSGERKSPVLPVLFLIVLLVVVGGAWYYIQNLGKVDDTGSTAWEPPVTDDTLLLQQDGIKSVIIENYNKHDYIDQFRKEIKEKPNRSRNIIDITIRNLAKEKNFNALIDLHDLIVFEYPDNERNYYNFFGRHLNARRGDVYEFEKVLRKRIEDEPHAIHFNLASKSAERRRDFPEAVKYKNESIKCSEDLQLNYRQLALLYERLQETDKIIVLYEKIQEITDKKFMFAGELIRNYGKADKNEKISEWINSLPEDEDISAFHMRILADAYNEIGDYQNGLKTITEAYTSKSSVKRDRIGNMLHTLAQSLDGLGTYELPEEIKKKLPDGERITIMLYLAEAYTRTNKYYVGIENYNPNGARSSSTGYHNFPAAIQVMADLEKTGIFIPKDQQFLYDRLKAMIAHYQGDIPAALEYYGRQADKEFPQNLMGRFSRYNAITQKTNDFIYFLKREGVPEGKGKISGKLRAYGKPITGMTVILRWNNDENNRWYHDQPKHPLQLNFYNNESYPPGVQAVTDSSGEFVVEKMPAGSYDITFIIDNARINPEKPEIKYSIMGVPPEIKLRDGQSRDLGWIDLVEPIELIEPETEYIVYDDTLRIAWDWKAPSYLENYKYFIFISNRFGLRHDASASIVHKDAGTNNYFDLELDKVFPNSDLSIYISAQNPRGQTLSSTSFYVSYPRYNGLTSERNQLAKRVGQEMRNVWRDRKYESFINQAEIFLEEYPDSTIADDAAFLIASSWQNLGNKEKAQEAYDRLFKTFPDSPLMLIIENNRYRDYNVAAGYAQLTGDNENEIRKDLDANARRSRKGFRDNPRVQGSVSSSFALLSKSLSWTFIILSCVFLIMVIQIVSTRKR